MPTTAPHPAAADPGPVQPGARDRAAASPVLTAQTRQLVRDTYAMVEPAGDLVSEVFHRKLFALEPGLRPLLDGGAQARRARFTGGLRVALATLDRFDELAPVLRLLGARFRTLGITALHYGAVGEAMLWTLRESLGADFTPEAQDAWVAVFTRIAEEMEGA